jgi:gliding-associated putative ABC transporter substrate-binding component GldG
MARRHGFLASGGSVGFLVMVLAILALVNFISVRRFARLDLTQNKEYTVSASTKKILKRLDDVVNVTVYFSKDLPPYLATLDRQVKDILDEYRAFSGGRLRIKFEDPKDDSPKERSLQMLGIPKVQLNILEKEKAQLTNVYLGMAIQYADKNEVIPVIQSTENLEYDITSAILKVTQPPASIGFLTGHDEPGMERGEFGGVSEALRKQYEVTTVSTSSGQPVPANVKTLIVARPEKRLTERDRYEVDQFLMRGGRIVFLADGTLLQPQSLMARPLDSGLSDMLGHYGAKVNSDLIVDRANVTTSFSTGFMSFIIPYPWFPRILPENLSKKSPITNGLESVVFPWVSTIETTVAVDTTGVASTSGVMAEVLAWTSKASFIQKGNLSVNPQQTLPRPAPSDLKRFPVAVALTGTFKSFFAGRPAPPPSDSAAVASAPNPTTIDESPPTQVVIVSDADFVTDQFASQYPQNLTFFQNTVDWCTMGEELISIRSKGGAIRPLKPVSDGTRGAVKLANTIVVPALVVGFGLVRWASRRRSRTILEKYREVA